MKKHSTVIRTLAAIVLAGAALVSCSKEKEAITGTFTMTIQASMGDNATKHLELDGNTIAAEWAQGEEVTVYNESRGAALEGFLVAQYDGTTTTLDGTLTGTIEEGDVLTLKFLSPNYDNQDGTLATIAATCDYATATVEVESVSGGNVTAEGTAAFESQQAIVKFTLKDAGDGTETNFNNLADLNVTELVVTVGSDNYTVTPTSETNELYVAIPGFTTGHAVTLTATVSDDTYTYEKSGVTFANGHYYTIAVKMTKQVQTPEGAISGLFTVSDDNGVTTKQVYFSQGNLQYNKLTSQFSFMDHQWSTVETIDQNVGDNYADQDIVSLFGWGTWTGSSPSPTQTSTSGTYNWDDHDFTQTLSNGSGIWRTLTKNEWGYLFNTRSGATVNGTSGRRYTMATVNSVKGIILLPDDATFESGEAGWGTFNAASNYTTTCTTAQWSGLEAKGCVFLPAAGSRDGTSLSSVGAQGHYWSSTPHNGVSNNAYFLFFRTNTVITQVNGDRYHGKCVRLVQDKN